MEGTRNERKDLFCWRELGTVQRVFGGGRNAEEMRRKWRRAMVKMKRGSLQRRKRVEWITVHLHLLWAWMDFNSSFGGRGGFGIRGLALGEFFIYLVLDCFCYLFFCFG